MNDLPELPDPSGFIARTQRAYLDFLKADLALCFTFADLVDTELQSGDREAALRVKAKTERGYETIADLLTNTDDGSEKAAIRQRLTELRSRLDALAL